ncbi:MAG TPA: LuxR C-terminal-related transcriptional regulator [Anaerolineales bacterium]
MRIGPEMSSPVFHSPDGYTVTQPVWLEVRDPELEEAVRKWAGNHTGVRVAGAGARPRSQLRTGRSSGNDAGAGGVARCVVIASEFQPAQYLAAACSGIWAVVTATEGRLEVELAEAVAAVQAGKCPILQSLAARPTVAARALDRLATGQVAGLRNSPTPLTGGETQILARIARGQTSKKIAEDMGFQLQTVKNRVTQILNKMGAHTRTHAAAMAQANGWLTEPLDETA